MEQDSFIIIPFCMDRLNTPEACLDYVPAKLEVPSAGVWQLVLVPLDHSATTCVCKLMLG